MKIARILSIDGGGIRGLIPATIIAHLEKQLGPIAQRFHMLSGTSTGGILACGLCQEKPMTAESLVSFYKERGPSIFDSSWSTLGGVADVKYDASKLEDAIKAVLSGNISQIANNELLITAYDLENRLPFLFKSWKARGIELKSGESPKSNAFLIKDVARCTSAAPTYFKPALVKNAAGKQFAMVDGGVFANNPAMCAYVAARRIYPNAEQYQIISIGTGTLTHPYAYSEAVDWGLVGWARPLLDIMFAGSSDTVDYQLDQLAPQVMHHRVQSSLVGASEEMDDVTPENLDALIKVAGVTIDKNKDLFNHMIDMLKEPVSTREELGFPKVGKPAPPRQLPPKIKGVGKVKQVVKEVTDNPVPAIGATGGALVGFGLAGPVGAAVGAVAGWVGGKNV